MEKMELVSFTCHKCGRMLAQSLPSAKVLCKKCNRWVDISDSRFHEPSATKIRVASN